MEYQNLKSYSQKGDKFILGMMTIQERWAAARELFTTFIEQNGFSAWHIHDGWVTHKHNNGDILHHQDITITWIDSHAGYSHTSRCPNAGEKMVIISRSPDGTETKPFDIYCYDVTHKSKLSSYEIKLKRTDIIQAIFNQEVNKYQFHNKHSHIFSFLFDK